MGHIHPVMRNSLAHYPYLGNCLPKFEKHCHIAVRGISIPFSTLILNLDLQKHLPKKVVTGPFCSQHSPLRRLTPAPIIFFHGFFIFPPGILSFAIPLLTQTHTHTPWEGGRERTENEIPSLMQAEPLQKSSANSPYPLSQLHDSPPLISAATHLFLLLGHCLPDLTRLLGQISDTDAGMVGLDLLSAGIEPQHVGRHGPLGGIGVFALLHLHNHPMPSVTYILQTPYILPKILLGSPTWGQNGERTKQHHTTLRALLRTGTMSSSPLHPSAQLIRGPFLGFPGTSKACFLFRYPRS